MRVSPTEHRHPGEHLIHDQAQGKHIVLRTDLAPADVLGRQITGGTDQLLVLFLAAGEQAGDAEVHDLRDLLRIQDDIRRFEIAMHDAGSVGLTDTLQQAAKHLEFLRMVELVCTDRIGQQLTFHIFEHHVRRLFQHSRFVDGDDIRMLQATHGPGLSPVGLLPQGLVQQLDRHPALQLGIRTQIDRTLTAGTQLLAYPKSSDGLWRHNPTLSSDTGY